MAGKAKGLFSGGAGMAMMAGIGVALLVGAGIVTAVVLRGMGHDADDVAAYAASGPPCPAVTPAQLETNGPHLRHSFTFGDATYSYAFGGADCAWIKQKGAKVAVCRFDSPGSVGAKTATGPQALFTPGIGKHAATILRDETFSCVVTAKEMG
jgi:hypothetical protein